MDLILYNQSNDPDLIVLHRKSEALEHLVSLVDELEIPLARMMKMRIIQHNGNLFGDGVHAQQGLDFSYHETLLT